MASHSAGGVTYYLSLPVQHREALYSIRHWDNLKIAFEEETVWIKDLTNVQLDSIEIKTIAYKHLYYTTGHQLFLVGSLLPDRTIPSLLWSPVERGLPVVLPAFNHNFFGVNDKASIRLFAADEEQDAYALMVTVAKLRAYIESAPAIRLQALSWVIVDKDFALIFGTPLLPLGGDVYWRKGDFLFPAGYRLELSLSQETIDALVNPDKEQWIIWNKDGTYWTVAKEAATPLSIASFRQTAKL